MPGDGSTTAISGLVVDASSGEPVAGTVSIREGRIVDVSGRARGRSRDLVAPGFVDLQVNGVDDVECSSSGTAGWQRAGELLAATGVTAWLPTIVSRPLGSYAEPLASVASACARTGPGPVVLGAHLEGPFLGSPAGAHRPEDIVDIDPDWLAELPDTVRIVTLAPEQPGALEAIRELRRRGVVVSLGHSAADIETARRAFDAGARMVTHLFNAMAPLHHRRPGLAGAALDDPSIVAGLIADLVHVHPAMIRLAFRTKGAAGLALVTDSVAWRAERLASLRIAVRDGAPRLPDGTLAGSTLTMDDAVRNAVAAGIPPADALRAASTTPATVLGEVDRGRIEVGARADLVVLDADDLTVRRTVTAGVTTWEA